MAAAETEAVVSISINSGNNGSIGKRATEEFQRAGRVETMGKGVDGDKVINCGPLEEFQIAAKS
jgi:hypothetical protein